MAADYVKRMVIVVPAADRDRANAAALAFDPEGGAGTFSSGLSADGAAPATHFWCAAVMTEATYQAVQALIVPEFPDGRFYDWDLAADPAQPEQVLQGLGLQRVGG